LALGFSKVEVRDALSKIEDKGIQSAEEQIKEALRLLAGSKDR
jgi:Holliday junction DNA helicase RuvA